jgi:carboxylesterase type B
LGRVHWAGCPKWTYPLPTLVWATIRRLVSIKGSREWISRPFLTDKSQFILDIWVPPNATSTSSLPVKVWIYEGGEDSGSISDPLCNGCNIAEQGSLLVSINYRLGPSGFLAVESAGIAGNFGIENILLGLKWIESNIASFGGDPVRFSMLPIGSGANDRRRKRSSFSVN